MSFSLIETETLARKAARGAGMSWGLAEEAGFAVRWSEARGLPGAELLAALLQQTDGDDRALVAPQPGDVWRAEAPFCPITAGAALADRAGMLPGQALRLGPVRYPLLLLPYLAETGQAGLSWADTDIRTGGGVTVEGDARKALATEVTCGFAASGSLPCPPTQWRAGVTPETLAVLNRFAHRTYAPDTEASRLAGAGAGLTDND
ncbi:MAG: DUF3726 domain-containing protein [Rhodobacteraceae bacterium]|nr:DUF3726 domain-containing protein [Paracoccaceae bacterium]